MGLFVNMTLNTAGPRLNGNFVASNNAPVAVSIEEPAPLRYLELGEGRRIAYRHVQGHRKPTLLYVPGFFAPMTLRKTIVLEEYALRNGYSNVRYDQECVGQSTGSQLTIEFEHWVEDALALVDRVCQGPVVLIASSLGGWISTIVAQRRPERIHGIVLLAPGFNCLRPGYWYHYSMLPEEVRARVDAGEEQIKIKMRYGGVGILRRDFCENTNAFELDFSQPINVSCPVRIIHGVKDADAPSEASLLYMERLTTEDVDVILRKTGDHRLNSRDDHQLLLYEVDRLLKQNPVVNSKL